MRYVTHFVGLCTARYGRRQRNKITGGFVPCDGGSVSTAESGSTFRLVHKKHVWASRRQSIHLPRIEKRNLGIVRAGDGDEIEPDVWIRSKDQAVLSSASINVRNAAIREGFYQQLFVAA